MEALLIKRLMAKLIRISSNFKKEFGDIVVNS